MKILLVDDHILFREGLRSLLSEREDYCVVGTAETISETVKKAQEYDPDLILMNFNLSDGNGLEATQTLLAERPKTKIVFLTTYEEDERLFEAIRFGAVGYLNKGVSLNKFLTYIESLKIREDVSIDPM